MREKHSSRVANECNPNSDTQRAATTPGPTPEFLRQLEKRLKRIEALKALIRQLKNEATGLN